MRHWWIENKKVIKPILFFVFGLFLSFPFLILINDFNSLTKLYAVTFRGSHFNFLLTGLLGIVFIVSSIVQLIKIIKNK